MKKTIRDNWRVVAVIRPTRAPELLALLGFKDPWGQPLRGSVHGGDFEITIRPSGPNWVEVGDVTFVRENEGEKGCIEIRDGLRRHPNVIVIETRIECDEEHTCSHCYLTWEELTVDEAADECTNQDKHSIAGEPVCCEKAIDEFRTERGIPLLECST